MREVTSVIDLLVHKDLGLPKMIKHRPIFSDEGRLCVTEDFPTKEPRDTRFLDAFRFFLTTDGEPPTGNSDWVKEMSSLRHGTVCALRSLLNIGPVTRANTQIRIEDAPLDMVAWCDWIPTLGKATGGSMEHVVALRTGKVDVERELVALVVSVVLLRHRGLPVATVTLLCISENKRYDLYIRNWTDEKLMAILQPSPEQRVRELMVTIQADREVARQDREAVRLDREAVRLDREAIAKERRELGGLFHTLQERIEKLETECKKHDRFYGAAETDRNSLAERIEVLETTLLPDEEDSEDTPPRPKRHCKKGAILSKDD